MLWSLRKAWDKNLLNMFGGKKKRKETSLHVNVQLKLHLYICNAIFDLPLIRMLLFSIVYIQYL